MTTCFQYPYLDGHILLHLFPVSGSQVIILSIYSSFEILLPLKVTILRHPCIFMLLADLDFTQQILIYINVCYMLGNRLGLGDSEMNKTGVALAHVEPSL